MYILTDGKNYVMDDPIHPGRVMYSTSPVKAKKFTYKQARALLNNKSKKLSWIRSFNMVDDSSGEKIAEQEVKSRSNKGVFVGKNDIDFDISILDQIMQETNTRKMHGTSARTMKTVKVTKKNNLLRRLFRMCPKTIREVSVVSGSRRVVLKDMARNDGYYSDNGFRRKYHDILKDKLPEGCEIFYEIVGYVNESTPIMSSVSNKSVKDKAFIKKFGDTTIFSYGCKPGESEMYVYRMTMTTADGTVVEVPWEVTKIWCDKLGVKHVPDLEKFIYTTPEDLKMRVNKYLDGMPVDEIGKTHIAEGVVVRIDNRETFTAFKDKVFEFKVVEGIAKDTSDTPDIEEAEELYEEKHINMLWI